MSYSALLKPLKYPDYRRFWYGLAVSMTGSNVRNAALFWHVTLLVEEEQRAIALGTVGLVRAVGILGCGLFAGVLADAADRRKLLIWINAAMFGVSLVLAFATLQNVVTERGLYLAAALFAVGGTFDNPARTSYYPMLLPHNELPNAVVLSGAVYQGAAVIGPALAGAIMAHFSVGFTYLFDAVSFLVFAVNLLRVSVSGLSPVAERAKLDLSAVADGLRFVFKHPLIRTSMLLDFVATFFASATALLPLYVQDVLHAGAGDYGALSAAIAIGAVTTGVVAASRIERAKRRGHLLFGSVFAYGLFTCAFAYSHWFALSFVCLVFIGAADTVSTIVRQLIRQLETPSRLRGRMQGVNLLFFMGGPQLGEWEAGLAAHHFGLKFSVFLGGAACAASALGFTLLSPAVRAYTRPNDDNRPEA